MADNIGVLGSATGTTVGTTTAYTCPANKRAKLRIMAKFQGGTNSQVGILVNGLEVARNAAMTANDYNWTAKSAGILQANGAALPDGTTAAKTVAPADPIYYLNPGQTVQYTILTLAMVSMNFQVVGVEIDLSA